MVDSTVKLVEVPPKAVSQLWPLVAHSIATCCERSFGRYTPEVVFAALQSGDQQLWVVWRERDKSRRATMVTEIRKYATGLQVLEIVFVTGVNRKEWVHLLAELEALALENGCTRVVTWARPGWEKALPGYQKTHIMLEKELQPDLGVPDDLLEAAAEAAKPVEMPPEKDDDATGTEETVQPVEAL